MKAKIQFLRNSKDEALANIFMKKFPNLKEK